MAVQSTTDPRFIARRIDFPDDWKRRPCKCRSCRLMAGCFVKALPKKEEAMRLVSTYRVRASCD